MTIDALTSTTKPIRLYEIRAIEIATFLASCLAGAFLLSRNFRALGELDKARSTLAYGVLGFVGVTIAIGSIAVPEQMERGVAFAFQTAQVLAVRIIALRANGAAIARHQKEGGVFLSRWRAAGIAILLLPVVVVVFVATVVLFPGLPAWRSE